MLTEQRVEAIFQQMDELVIQLDHDPGSLGPQYFQDLIATCRNYLNSVGLVLNELNRDRLSSSCEVRRLEAAYDLEYDNLLANDESVKELGSSIEDRKAAVGWRLRAERAALTEARSRLHDLNAVHKVVQFRNKELHATMTAIRDQKRLMVAEIRSGSFYGDERPNSPRPGEDDGGGVSAEELARIMSGEEGSSDLRETFFSSPQESKSDGHALGETVSVQENESDALKFLGGSETSATIQQADATDADDDLDALLKNV